MTQRMMLLPAVLAVIALTGVGRVRAEHSSLAGLIAVECSIFAIGAGLVWVSTHHHVQDRDESLLLAAAAGALFGVSDVAIKYTSLRSSVASSCSTNPSGRARSP